MDTKEKILKNRRDFLKATVGILGLVVLSKFIELEKVTKTVTSFKDSKKNYGGSIYGK